MKGMRRESVVLVLGTAAALACGPQVELEDEGSGGAESSSTGSAMTTVGPTTVGTTVGSSITVTTDPGDPTTTGVDPDESGSGTTGAVIPEDCSTIEQDCPPGWKCMPWANDGGSSWNDTKCEPIADDPSAPGEACTVGGNGVSGVDDCDGTSMCWDVDPETNVGTCQPFCIGTDEEPTCADPCDTCPQFSDGVITLCFTACDPLIQDCAPGEACYPSLDTFVCAPVAGEGGLGIGSPCEYVNVCPPGMACLGAEVVPGCEGGIGCCAPYCPVGGADPCPGLLPGSSCVPWYEDPQAGPPQECQSAPPGVCIAE